MVKLVRNSLLEYAEGNYGIIRRDQAQKKRKLESAISGLHVITESAQRSGQTEAAEDWASGESQLLETLREVKRDSTKTLGALKTKILPFAPLYLVCLEEYIAAKTGRKPQPRETAHIVSALLMGFDRYPKDGVDPDLLAKKLKRFRERNPLYMETVRRITSCDSSGENELDRKLSKPVAADRI